MLYSLRLFGFAPGFSSHWRLYSLNFCLFPRGRECNWWRRTILRSNTFFLYPAFSTPKGFIVNSILSLALLRWERFGGGGERLLSGGVVSQRLLLRGGRRQRLLHQGGEKQRLLHRAGGSQRLLLRGWKRQRCKLNGVDFTCQIFVDPS